MGNLKFRSGQKNIIKLNKNIYRNYPESSALDTERRTELGRVREGGKNDQKWSRGQTRGQRRDLINTKQTASILVTIFLAEGKYFVSFLTEGKTMWTWPPILSIVGHDVDKSK